MRKHVYGDNLATFYCGCDIVAWKLDTKRCGYKPAQMTKRARRIEWEHVVPASAFGRAFVEWRDGDPRCLSKNGLFKGRRCARKTSKTFRRMEADMHNLVPVIGEINAMRGRFSMAIIEGEAREFGGCDVEIADRKIEPRPQIRGDVARTYFYMDGQYPGRGIISRKNRKLYRSWDKADPVSPDECARARRIDAIQQRANAIVGTACALAGLW